MSVFVVSTLVGAAILLGLVIWLLTAKSAKPMKSRTDEEPQPVLPKPEPVRTFNMLSAAELLQARRYRRKQRKQWAKISGPAQQPSLRKLARDGML